MSRRCERPGCSIAASVAYGFDSERSLVWLEAVDDSAITAVRGGVVCRRHADAMRPPRGWSLEDRRPSAMSLFDPAPPVAAHPAVTPPGPAARRAPRPRRPGAAEGSLDGLGFEQAGFDFDAPPVDAPPAHSQPRPPGRLGGDRVGAQAAGADLATPDAAPAVVAPDVVEADETRMIPWAPHFDQSDDLGGLLRATSPLLSRAFGRRPPREEPDDGRRPRDRR